MQLRYKSFNNLKKVYNIYTIVSDKNIEIPGNQISGIIKAKIQKTRQLNEIKRHK